jgi:hypothetical protein
VIDVRAVERFGGAVREAERDGAIVTGGGRPDRTGLDVEPTIVSGLPAGRPLTREELSVPFVTATRVARSTRRSPRPTPSTTAHGRDLQPRRRRGRQVPRRDRSGRRLRQPARGRDDRGVAGHPVVLRLEEQPLDREGRSRALLRPAVHARAEPHRRRGLVDSSVSSVREAWADRRSWQGRREGDVAQPHDRARTPPRATRRRALRAVLPNGSTSVTGEPRRPPRARAATTEGPRGRPPPPPAPPA